MEVKSLLFLFFILEVKNHVLLCSLIFCFLFIVPPFLIVLLPAMCCDCMCLLVMIGESSSVEKELESTRAANAVYQDKTNILFSVRTLLFNFENRQK